jgi:hypothetical protein
MGKLFRFFSYAALTQVVLLLNQVVLLPIQIRLWGVSKTATWYEAIALATITTFADLGMRTAGHVELLQFVKDRDAKAGAQLAQVWGWIRVLVCALTFVLLLWSAVESGLHGAFAETIWKDCLVVAYAIETLLIVRIVYLDSLGHYSSAEATYFTFAILRLALALPALLVFHAQPSMLGGLLLGTSVLGIALQSRLCRKVGILGLFDPIPRRLSFDVLASARHTVADPLSNWMRIGFPVLILQAIATPQVVTTFVALRAVFGASRTTIQQMARVASVEYLRLQSARRSEAASSVLSGFVQLGTLLGAAIGAGVVIDNLRILGMWLKHMDRPVFQAVLFMFAFSAPFYSYQIVVNLMFRMGRLAGVAHRQYGFIFFSFLFAGVALIVRSLTIYLTLMVVAEILLSASFLVGRLDAAYPDSWKIGARGIAGSFAGISMIAVLWMVVGRNHMGIFTTPSVDAYAQSLGFWLIGALALGAFQMMLDSRMFVRSARSGWNRCFALQQSRAR